MENQLKSCPSFTLTQGLGRGLCVGWGEGGGGGYAVEERQQELPEKGREREQEPALSELLVCSS